MDGPCWKKKRLGHEYRDGNRVVAYIPSRPSGHAWVGYDWHLTNPTHSSHRGWARTLAAAKRDAMAAYHGLTSAI